MFLGKVIGTLVATQKEASLDGLKFLVVRRLSMDNQDERGYVVAADAVGAGLGELRRVMQAQIARPVVGAATGAVWGKRPDLLIAGFDGLITFRQLGAEAGDFGG